MSETLKNREKNLLSIVIPVYNEEQTIQACLEELTIELNGGGCSYMKLLLSMMEAQTEH